MKRDLRAMYEQWASGSGTGSVKEFADWFFLQTNVSLGSVLSEEEQESLLEWFGGDEGMLEGIDSGP